MTFHITDFSTEVLSNVQIKKETKQNPLNIIFFHTLLYDLTQIALRLCHRPFFLFKIYYYVLYQAHYQICFERKQVKMEGFYWKVSINKQNSKCDSTPNHQCILWNKTPKQNGYGVIKLKFVLKENRSKWRVSIEKYQIIYIFQNAILHLTINAYCGIRHPSRGYMVLLSSNHQLQASIKQ